MTDVFGRMVRDFHRGQLAGHPVYERSDGDESPAHLGQYFAEPPDWGPLQQTALEWVRGGVLDAGCGPGRALDPLADRGHRVLGVDESPGAVRVASERTDQPAVVGDLATPPVRASVLDTALFLGTHVWAGGTVDAVETLLETLADTLSEAGRVVADCYDPTAVEDEALRAYLADRWLQEGVATRRFRIRYDGVAGRWRTLLMADPTALERFVAPTGWEVGTIERGTDSRYLFVLERAD